MADLSPIKLSEMNTASAIDVNSIIYVAIEDALSETGFASKKTSAAAFAQTILNSFTWPLLLTKTTAQSVIGAINEVAGTKVTGTLTAGSTSITLSDAAITSTSLIDVYNDAGIGYESITASTGSVTITFEAQAANMSVEVVVK